jgi:hypothetical protein
MVIMNLEIKKDAVIDHTGKYRYSLLRSWDDTLNTVVFIMLNPSTADANEDDPTIRRCTTYAKSWGYGSLEVVNLFAYRATDPNQLLVAEDPIGFENNSYILKAISNASLVVLAWGTKGILLNRHKDVLSLLHTNELHCISISKDGHPKHPLYLKGDAVPQIYSIR